MFQKWFGAKRRADSLSTVVAELRQLPAIADEDLIRFVMRSFDQRTMRTDLVDTFDSAYLDVSGCDFAQHGRNLLNLDRCSACTIALRTNSSAFCLLEHILCDEYLCLCGVDIKHLPEQFPHASAIIGDAIENECEALGYFVPSWDGDAVSFLRHDVEGLWWSNLQDVANVVKLVEKNFGKRCFSK